MTSDRRSNARPWPPVLRRRLVLAAVVIALSCIAGSGAEVDVTARSLAEFDAAIKAGDDEKALSIGQSIFESLKVAYRSDAGFRALESRLNAAEFLARQMRQQLGKAAGAQLFVVADEVFAKQTQQSGPNPWGVAPAKRFYETSINVFAKPVQIAGLGTEERAFLAAYYDLKIRRLTVAVAKAGQALAIAAPDFKGTHDYTLVLPLLHVSGGQPLNTNALPRWMKVPEQMRQLSNSCLLHFELPFQAMVVARSLARTEQVDFSEYDFYRSAARRCWNSQASVAADCLRKAMAQVPAEQVDLVVELKFDTVQLWLDSGNFAMAAGEVHTLFMTYPQHRHAGRAIWLYYYALSRSNNTAEILTTIDQALANEQCTAYRPKLLYIKWWALRRQRDQAARVAALEYELLERYGTDPMVAPILLSRATDLLASQSYTGAYEILHELVEKFPSTRAASQARRMLERLKTTAMEGS